MHSHNSTEYTLELKNSEMLFLLVFNSLEIIFGALSNCFVISVFLLANEMRKRPSDLLIFNLATADLILLTAFQPWLTIMIHQNSIASKYYFFYEGLNTFVQLASGHAVLLIACDRFIAVTFPLKYQSWVTRKSIYQLMTLFWVLAFLIGIVNVMAYELHFHNEFLIFWITFQLILLLSITAMYVVIFASAFKQGKRIWRRESISETERIRDRVMFKITMNTFILVCFFYATFLPVIIYITHSSLVNHKENMFQMRTRAWIYSFSPLNCCFNPVFYVFRTERFKQVCYRLGKQSTKNESMNMNIVNESA